MLMPANRTDCWASERRRMSIQEFGGVEEGTVLEGLDIEVRIELAVEHVEHVLVELGRDPGSVVVGGLQPRGLSLTRSVPSSSRSSGPSSSAIRARNSRRGAG